MTIFRPFALCAVTCAVTLLAACSGTGQERPTSGSAAAPPATAEQILTARGFAFAQEQCSGCHALLPGMEPPNPQAPSFVEVANEMAFTPATLREFFVDKHDTPDKMAIELDEDQAEIVTAYIMSLRKAR